MQLVCGTLRPKNNDMIANVDHFAARALSWSRKLRKLDVYDYAFQIGGAQFLALRLVAWRWIIDALEQLPAPTTS